MQRRFANSLPIVWSAFKVEDAVSLSSCYCALGTLRGRFGLWVRAGRGQFLPDGRSQVFRQDDEPLGERVEQVGASYLLPPIS